MKDIDIREDLLKKRYYKQGENCKEDLFKRVAHSIATAPEEEVPKETEKVFFKMMNNFDALPSTPCLLNANAEHTGQLSACFIIQVKDNIESIYKAKSDMAKIFQSNGGVGFNLSALRPKDANVETHGGKSCGVIGFLEEFDLTADIITRNNVRKGAIKCDIAVFHPDIIEFISCKDEDGKLTHMNISVAVTDDFMEAVKNNKTWSLRFPDYSKCKEDYNKYWDGDIAEWEERNLPVKIYQTLQARDLYRLIMEHAWKTGEPGISMVDTMNNANTNPHLGKVMSTNPCFTGDMRLLTENGYKTFEELCDKEVSVINVMKGVSTGKVWCSGEKEIVELGIDGLADNIIIKCTPNHLFLSMDGRPIEAENSLGEYLEGIDGLCHKVYSVKHTGQIEKVYDFTEPLFHWGYVEDMMVHNCAEFCNIPYSSCNLMSINLSHLVENEKFKFARLRELIYNCVRFLDNMVSVNNLPTEEIDEITKGTRPIGLGFMGYADMLYEMKIKYGDEDCLFFTKHLFETIQRIAQEASQVLAVKRGVYPYYKGSVWEHRGINIRNSNLISIAPNGSLSTLANTSGGIEPNFALVYTRRTNEGDEYKTVNPIFERYLKENGLYSNDLLNKIIDNQGSCQNIDEIPSDAQNIFVVSSDLNQQEHINVVAAAQKYVDLSISKTVNLPSNATIEDVENIYMEAWEKGLKGVTIYRDGSRENQVLFTPKSSTKTQQKEPKLKENSKDDISVLGELNSITPINRKDLGQRLNGSIYSKEVACGKLYIIISHNNKGELVEVFVDGAKSGGCTANTECIGRLCSLALRAGCNVEKLIDSIRGIKCGACQQVKGSKVKHIDGLSCGDVIAKTIAEEYSLQNKITSEKNSEYATDENSMVSQATLADNDINTDVQNKSKCPECGADSLIHTGGCVQCHCGWTKCG